MSDERVYTIECKEVYKKLYHVTATDPFKAQEIFAERIRNGEEQTPDYSYQPRVFIKVKETANEYQ